jgi:hypothetical protein
MQGVTLADFVAAPHALAAAAGSKAPVGLVNPGYTMCYINAAFQVLRRYDPLMELVRSSPTGTCANQAVPSPVDAAARTVLTQMRQLDEALR